MAVSRAGKNRYPYLPPTLGLKHEPEADRKKQRERKKESEERILFLESVLY